jgi:hypothetical protein
MKKILVYFCLFFTGSLLPFLLVESYLQDYGTLGILIGLAGAILLGCFFLEYLKTKVTQWVDVRNKDFAYSHHIPIKKEATKEISYYMRSIW